jgi:concanavalin A-like lectin/glucanase superfamily protein
MTATLYPPGGTNLVNLQTNGYLELGNQVALKFDGSSPFSIEAWIQPHAGSLTGSFPIFSKVTEFELSIINGVLSAKTATQQNACVGQTSLAIDQWNYVAVTFDGTYMYLYLDGCQDAQQKTGSCGVTPTSHSFRIGSSDGNTTLDADVMGLLIANACRPPQKMYKAFKDVTTKSSTVAAYDCSQSPPADASGHNNPIALVGTAVSQHSQLVLQLSGTGYALPSTSETGLTPAPGAPYTLEGWYWLDSPTDWASYVLYANSTTPIYDHNGYIWLAAPSFCPELSKLDALHEASYAYTQDLAANTWYHVATTYDGTTLSVYVNGALQDAKAVPPFTAAATPNPMIGACYDRDMGLACFLQGYIQYISFWNVCLTAAQIKAMTEAPVMDEGLVANFSFIGAPAVDTVDGDAVALEGDAQLTDQRQPPVSTLGAVSASAVKRRILVPPNDLQFPCRQAHGGRAGRSVPAATMLPLSPAHIAALRRQLERAFPAEATAEMKQRLHALFDDNLAEAQRLARDQPELVAPPRWEMNEVDGRQQMTIHFPDGPMTLDLGTDTVSPCIQFWVVFTATALMGFLSAIGIIGAKTLVRDFVVVMLSNQTVFGALSAVLAAVTPEDPLTSQVIIDFLRVFWDAGFLKTFFWMAIENLKWWILITVLAWALKAFVPGIWLASFIANTVATAAVLLGLFTSTTSGYQASCGDEAVLAT